MVYDGRGLSAYPLYQILVAGISAIMGGPEMVNVAAVFMKKFV